MGTYTSDRTASRASEKTSSTWSAGEETTRGTRSTREEASTETTELESARNESNNRKQVRHALGNPSTCQALSRAYLPVRPSSQSDR
jgi:hypothetical protein